MRILERFDYCAVLILIYVTLASILTVMGRPLWCSCGEFIPWAWEVMSKHNSQHLIDWYTFSHILHGVLFYWLFRKLMPRSSFGRRLVYVALLEAGWEILENTPLIIDRYRSATFSLDYYGDSVMNSLSDLTACMCGFFMAFKLPVKVSVAIFVVFELFTLACIRDNLTLNVLMLLWPIEGIKVWQAG